MMAGDSRQFSGLGAALWAALAVALATGLRGLLIPPGHEAGVDVYYHVTAGRLFPQIWASRTFPWTDLSLWKTCFYDKEWGFHLLLFALSGLRSLVGMSASAPFQLQYAGVALVVAGTMVWTLRRVAGRRAVAWVVLLPFVSPLFLYRFSMLRPHLVGMALYTVAAGICFGGGSRRRQRVAMVVLGAVSAWSYSNPHLALVPAGIHFLAGVLVKRSWRRIDLLACGVLGLLGGLALHPQTPNTFTLWWVQCVQVVREALSPSSGMGVGDELRGLRGLELVHELPMYVVGLATGLLALRYWPRRGRRRPVSQAGIQAVGLLALVLVGALLSKRTVEYVGPSAVLAVAVLTRDGRRMLGAGRQRARLTVLVAVCAGAFAMAGLSVRDQVVYAGPNTCDAEFRQIGPFLRQHIPAGSVVGNLNWSEFPQLFHAAPDYRYLVGLDPFFGYAADAARMRALETYRSTPHVLSREELAELAGTPLVFVGRADRSLLGKMVATGMAPVFAGDEGVLFDLRITPPPHRKD